MPPRHRSNRHRLARMFALTAVAGLAGCAARIAPPSVTVSPPMVAPPATAVPSASAASEPPSERARPTAAIVADVADRVSDYFADAGGDAALAIVDRVTGIRVAVNAGQRFRTASIVKVDILAALLWQGQRAGREPTEDQREIAERMITQSDNNAADALWMDIGRGPGLATANRAFGLTATTPGNLDYWGATFTTVDDQLRILGLLTDDSGPLTAAHRDYVLDLMGEVVPDQRWGVPAAAGDAEHVYVKNGWLATPTDNGLWIVNSIGRIVEPGHDFLLVVLSFHRVTEDDGVDVVEHAARIAVDGLRAG